MNNEFFKGRFFIVLIIIVLFLIGFMLNIAVDGGVTPPKEIIGIIFSPIEYVFSGVGSAVSDFFATFTEFKELKAENEELRQKINDLEIEAGESIHLQHENDMLKDIVGIKDIYNEFEFVSADIISSNMGGYYSMFTINKGSSSGIKKHNVVISSDGLVGIIRDVGVNWASIVTIIDPKSAVGAVIVRTKDMAMTEGSLELKLSGQCQLSYIDNNVAINRGDVVETSGLGGLYPAKLRIGIIEDIRVEEHGLSQYAIIQPFVDFEKIRSVYIITNFENDDNMFE